MKKIICVFYLFLVGNWAFSQSNPGTRSLINPEYVKYLNEVNAGTWQTVTPDGHGLGGFPEPTIIDFSNYTSNLQRNLPSSYDLRALGLLTPVKNQGNCASCWTFSIMGAVESQWKKLGYPDFDLSENHINNCHGFPSPPCNGGGAWFGEAYFSRGSGPILESIDPYFDGVNGCRTYTPVAIVIESRRVPNDAAAIKQAIMDHGALSTFMRWESASIRTSDFTFYYPNSGSTNHIVDVVGWDDNKPTAGGTGAWLIRNSWGPNWCDGGYFWIAYQDGIAVKGATYYPSRNDYVPNMKIYNYAQLGANAAIGWPNDEDYALVKYTATADQQIKNLSAYVLMANATISFEIYDSFNSSSGTLSGILGNSGDITTNLPGNYAFTLQTPVNITSGDDFYIKVKYHCPGHNYPISGEQYVAGQFGADPVIEGGVSWISDNGANGSWMALGQGTNFLYDLCISAYATPALQATLPILTTTSATIITGSSAISGGNITANGGASVSARGICWGTGLNPNITDAHSSDGTGIGIFLSTISGLSPSTLYHYRAYATNSAGTAYGNDLTFTTLASANTPIVTANAATSISANAATLNGTANASNLSSAITFEYGLTTLYGNVAIATPSPISGNTNTSESAVVTGLTPSSTYHFRMVGVNANGASNSNDQTFTTLCATPITQASNFSVTAASGTSVTVNWTRGSGGNVLVVAKANSAVDTDPSSGTTYNANAVFGQGDQIGTGNYVVYKGSGTSVILTGLTSSVTYYFEVYEY